MIEAVVDWERDVEDWLLFQQGYEFGPGGGVDEVSVVLSLPVVAIADLTSPAELFRCAHFHNAILSAGSCIARQNLRKKAHGAAKDQTDKVPHHLEHCASGKCEQGNAVKARLADYVVPASAQERMAERRRAQGVAEVGQIEQQIAAKVASGELRVADPLPAAIAEDLANDLAAAAQQAERDRVAAAVEEVRPEVADRARATRKEWDEFCAAKEKQRAAAPTKEKPPREPHPLSRRVMVDEAVGAAVDALKEGRIPIRQEDKTMNLKGRPSALKDVSDADFRKAHEDLGGSVTALAEKFGSAWATTQKRVRALGLGGKPAEKKNGAPQRKPAQRRNSAPPPIPAQPVVHGGLLQARERGPFDFETMLSERIAYHEGEAARLGRALAALRGAA